MSKRILIFMLACILLVPSFLVSADMIWGNSFLEKNKTIRLDRNTFIVNGVSGYLKAQIAPDPYYEIEYMDSWAQLRRYNNGETIYLDQVYNYNGEYWGIGDYMMHGGPTGWFPMDQLLVMYVGMDFSVQSKDKFYEYTDGFNFKNIGDKLVTWQWPGSDRAKATYTFMESGFTQAEDDYSYYSGIDIKQIKIYCVYKDEMEREWGFIEIEADISVSIGHGGYKRQIINWRTWICLDDPSNTDIPAFNPAPEPVKWTPEPFENYNIPAFYDGVIVTPKLKGDINLDNKVNGMDLLLLKQHVLDVEGKELVSGTDEYWAADMNNDGAINGMDLLLLKKKILS